MRRFSFIGTFLLLVVFIIGFAWLVIGMVGRSFLSGEDSSDRIEGLSAETKITRNQYGVPYITAATANDAYAALGYAHAQDRLWQMDVMRRAGEGRLSEVFGRPTIGYDALMRTIGFKHVAEQILEKMPTETRSALEAYAHGVNAFIASHSGRFPMEFDAIGYEPEPWKPLHTVIITRLLAWELNTSFWTDVVYGEIELRVDSAMFRDILPNYPSYAPTIIPGGQRPEPLLERLRLNDPISLPVDTSATDTTGTAPITMNTPPVGMPNMGSVIELERGLRKFLGIAGAHIGSNAWVISGDRTAGGKPMLANDPHLTHSAPGRWYQAVLIYGKQRLAGVTIPGEPFVVIGRNNDIAWGITSMMADETDFYIEKLDTGRGRTMLHDGKWEKLALQYDTIRVADSLSVPIIIRTGRHGPLISDVHYYARRYPPKIEFLSDTNAIVASQAVAIRWIGRNVSHELTAWQRINEAKSLPAFQKAVQYGGIPGLSFVYADNNGAIAYVPSARIPIRGSANPNLPNPGWESRYNWKGTYEMKRLPTLRNPSAGYIASANNLVSNALPFFISDLWEDPSRAMRMEELLAEGDNFQQIDFTQMQRDVNSPQMRYMAEFLLRAFPDSARQGSAVRSAIAMLRSWDGSMLGDSPEAAIAAQWFQLVVEMTYKDELGDDLFRQFVFTAQLPIKALRNHVLTDSRWFDDIHTPKIEYRDDILRKALGTALEHLHERFGTWEIAAWNYGALHTLTFRHPFTDLEQLRGIVDIGPFEIGGSNTTLNNGEWDFNNPFEVRVGPSMRQIVDFADTTVFMKSVITTGQSGQPMSPRYENQTILWLSNGYLSLMATPPTGPEALSVTTLTPR